MKIRKKKKREAVLFLKPPSSLGDIEGGKGKGKEWKGKDTCNKKKKRKKELESFQMRFKNKIVSGKRS